MIVTTTTTNIQSENYICASFLHSRKPSYSTMRSLRLTTCYNTISYLLSFICHSLLLSFLSLLDAIYNINNHVGYIGEFEIIDDHRSNKIVVELIGRLNKCGVISPRFDVAVDEIEKWVVNLLPSRQFGHILLSTTYGIMTHEEARRKKTGGKILGFFY